uniref:Prolamin n=1 Tax=Avena sativa TaxID=4498 RepID=L0L5H3_AVESA|nr:gliadin-like avenin [Avena sativa]AGB56871.1 gliadin-like avenin [Avena sativa]
MKTFLIFALLAMAATMATAQYDPSEQYQPYPEQQPFMQPLLQQQMIPCQMFLMQKCSPVEMVPFLRSQILRQSTCHVMRRQCCRQLAQIPRQLRCPAIHSMVHAIIMQQQQQQLVQAQQMGLVQPQTQMAGQVFIQPQQLSQYQTMKVVAMQTLPAMCNVQVPPYCSTGQVGGMAAGIGGC